MFLSKVTFIASSASIVLAHPFTAVVRDVTAFPAGSSWDILLNKGDAPGNVKLVANNNFQVIDIDLFDTDKDTIADLKTTKQVICYFSAGTREDWRPDAKKFVDGDVGKNMDDWPDEAWLNVKSENVRNIMKTRIQKAAESGCTAIDPDNVDGFDGGQDGFGYGKQAYIDYVRFLAQEATNNNLAIGLKNAVDIIPDVVDVMQFAVNEECHQYAGECAKYKPFTDQNKAVFNIEYGGNNCEAPAGVKLSTLIKPEDQGLNTLGGACKGQNAGTPINGGNQESSTPVPEPVPTPSQTVAPEPVPTQAPVPTSIAEPAPPAPADPEEEEEEEEEEENNPGEEPSADHRPWQWWYWNRRFRNGRRPSRIHN